MALLACAVPVVAQGFRPELHFRYTLRAAKLLEACGKDFHVEPLLAQRLALGTRLEDETRIWQRVTNWHYAATPGIEPQGIVWPIPWPGHRNLDHIFKVRIDELHEALHERVCKAEEVFERAGRVLHFIQDMRVPGHVIPIHHGSILGEEPFDGYVFDYPEADLRPHCEALRRDAESAVAATFLERLGLASEHTRHRIDATFQPTQCKAKDIFWCMPDEKSSPSCDGWRHSGFGGFRKGVTFGDSLVPCGHATVPVSDTRYHDFFREGYEQMMRDSAFVLLYARHLAKKRSCMRAIPDSAP